MGFLSRLRQTLALQTLTKAPCHILSSANTTCHSEPSFDRQNALNCPRRDIHFLSSSTTTADFRSFFTRVRSGQRTPSTTSTQMINTDRTYHPPSRCPFSSHLRHLCQQQQQLCPRHHQHGPLSSPPSPPSSSTHHPFLTPTSPNTSSQQPIPFSPPPPFSASPPLPLQHQHKPATPHAKKNNAAKMKKTTTRNSTTITAEPARHTRWSSLYLLVLCFCWSFVVCGCVAAGVGVGRGGWGRRLRRGW